MSCKGPGGWAIWRKLFGEGLLGSLTSPRHTALILGEPEGRKCCQVRAVW